MSDRSKVLFVAFLLIIIFQLQILAANDYAPAKEDIVIQKELPSIGKWMISPENKPADWIGQRYDGKAMKEPINVIIIDHKAGSEKEAIAKLITYCGDAGYRDRNGHSSGYKGYIGGKVYDQLPSEKDHAFSDAHYEFNNDHGRMFGPYHVEKGYLFIGAFSREVIGIYNNKLTHTYGSFNRARDGIARGLYSKTDLNKVSYVDMGNKVDDPDTTTGDHDGKAVLLQN